MKNRFFLAAFIVFITLIAVFIFMMGRSVIRGGREYARSITPDALQIKMERAAGSGDTAQVAALIGGGAPVDLRIPRSVRRRGHPVTFKLTPLMIASERGDPDLMKLLLDRGADVNAREEYFTATPLIYAVKNGCRVCVELLIRRGADVNAVERHLRVNDYPALYFAIRGNRPDLVRALVEKGADVNFRNSREDWNPLAWARAYPEITAYLKSKGAR